MESLKYVSDRIRYSYLEDALSSDDSNSITKTSRSLLLDQDDLSYVEKKDGFIYYSELWVSSCWEGLYSKPEYKGLNKNEALQKIMSERFPLVADLLNLEIVDWSFDNSIQRVKFKIKSMNESKSEEYFGLKKSELIDDIENSEMDLDEYDSTEEVLDRLYKEILKTTKKKKIKLYRIIWVKDEKLINKNKLGHHWVSSLDSFHEEMIDYLYNNSTKNSKFDLEDDCYLITIETPNTNINLEETLIAQCNHPFEEEFYLESQGDIKILKIENFYS